MAAEFFRPLALDPSSAFTAREAAHLLRRAGFGASPAEIDVAVERGLEATVDDLLTDDEEEEASFQQAFESVAGSLVNFAEPGQVQAWWVHRMVKSRRPLREKLTLFWHGHFATSYQKVEDARLMLIQIDTLRRHAWADFRDIVFAMAQDPAMLVWLDGESSTRAHPNENFARELMELFTCGIGNYTEPDVLEAARAFTGWHREGSQFAFHPDDHDGERKQFLGKSGRFDGNDVIDILMQQPATPRFLARKLLRFFAAAEPADEAVAEAASLLDRTQLNIKWFLRELFLSQYFFSDGCYRRRIASPAELVIGTVRTLGARIPAAELVGQMSAMGQELLAPPNVKGWDAEQAWINSSTWPARLTFAQMISELQSDDPYGPNLPLEQTVSPDLTEPRDVVDTLANVLMQGDLAEELRQELAEFLVAGDEGPNPEVFRDEPGFRADKTRGALATVLGLPEYQAC